LSLSIYQITKAFQDSIEQRNADEAMSRVFQGHKQLLPEFLQYDR